MFISSKEIYAFIKCEIAHITLMFVSLYLGGEKKIMARIEMLSLWHLKPVKFQVRLVYYLKRFYLKRCSLSGVNRMCTQLPCCIVLNHLRKISDLAKKVSEIAKDKIFFSFTFYHLKKILSRLLFTSFSFFPPPHFQHTFNQSTLKPTFGLVKHG